MVLLDSNTMLNMNNEELLKIINNTLYPNYQFGDIVLNYPCSRTSYTNGCFFVHNKNFPDSLAIQYTKLYKGKKSLWVKIGKDEDLNENLSILLSLCNKYNVKDLPDKDALVATLRLGDMIERNMEGRNGDEAAEFGGTFWTQNGGYRYILSAYDIINAAKENNLKKIIPTGGKAPGTGIHSVKYLIAIVCQIVKEGYDCKLFCSSSPDEDLVFISNARYIITGPGGFCLVAKAISNFRFNKNEKILPIKDSITFF